MAKRDYYETQPAIAGRREFVDKLRAMDPGIVKELSHTALQVQLDHQEMCRAVYWLANNNPDPRNYSQQRMWHEEQATQVAEKWKPNIPPIEVAEIITRYVEITPANGEYRN